MTEQDRKQKRRKWEHEYLFWFERENLPRTGGDLGLYDYHHRQIARIVIGFEKIQSVTDRLHHVPQIQENLAGIDQILTIYDIDSKNDIERTLRHVNRWLPSHEIPAPKSTVRPKRAVSRGTRGSGNPWRR